jgi:hypothetical protein
MPTELGQEFSPLWRGNYAHMLEEDRPIWNRFLDANAHLFERVFYDVRIGGVYPGPEHGDDKMRKMFYDVTAKRIDALAELKDELWIVEVAVRPGLRATGQLMTYLALWFQDPKILKPTKGVLVTQTLDKDLELALTTYGMLVRYSV